MCFFTHSELKLSRKEVGTDDKAGQEVWQSAADYAVRTRLFGIINTRNEPYVVCFM